MTSPRSDRSSTSPSPSPGAVIIISKRLSKDFCFKIFAMKRRTLQTQVSSPHPLLTTQVLSQSLDPERTLKQVWLEQFNCEMLSTTFSDYVEFTKALEKSIEESEEAFENGFYFPQPPSPSFFTEAPTPEFIGQCLD